MVWDYIVSGFQSVIGWIQDAFEEVKSAFTFSNLELDWVAVGFTLIGSTAFTFMMWMIPTWDTYPIVYKIIISVLLPFIAYPMVLNKLNK